VLHRGLLQRRLSSPTSRIRVIGTVFQTSSTTKTLLPKNTVLFTFSARTTASRVRKLTRAMSSQLEPLLVDASPLSKLMMTARISPYRLNRSIM